MTHPDTKTEESDDAAFVERMLPKAHRDDGQMLGMCISDDDIVRLIALARRATTKSETDGAAILQEQRVSDWVLKDWITDFNGNPTTLSEHAAMDLLDARAALARTPAAERPLVARACLLQTRGQHPHTALPCTQCHFGPCEVCL